MGCIIHNIWLMICVDMKYVEDSNIRTKHNTKNCNEIKTYRVERELIIKT